MKLNAVNCVEQNKNNGNSHYLLWRVMTGRHKSAQLSFMLVWHTKFAPDHFFGSFKSCFISNYCSTMFDIERVVRESTITRQNIPQLVASIDGKEKYIYNILYQWSSFLWPRKRAMKKKGVKAQSNRLIEGKRAR